MRHKFPVLTVKKWFKSVYIYGSYRKNKIGVPFFGPPYTYMHAFIPARSTLVYEVCSL